MRFGSFLSKEIIISFFFLTLQEFAGFLYIKAVWGIEEK
jgi:hypothetical protein